jgi:LAS superfamily LD-carboxypeptidase LdcB
VQGQSFGFIFNFKKEKNIKGILKIEEWHVRAKI